MNKQLLNKVVFYADKSGGLLGKGYANKRFSFKVKNLVKAYDLVKYFQDSGNKIRSALYFWEFVDSETGEIKTAEIDLLNNKIKKEL